jgi:hypothetical protein
VQKYDVAIVGAGIAGLCTAALLSSAGRKVFLADQSDRPGGAVMPIEKDGMLLSPGPDITYGFERSGAFQSLHAALGIDRDVAGRPARYQVALPDHRITVAPQNEETLEELRREFPREIDTVVRLYRDSGKISLRIATSRLFAYLSGKRSASAFLQRYRLSPGLISFYDIQSRFFFRKPISDLSLRTLVLMLHTPPEHLSGGGSMLASRLLAHSRDRGTDVHLNEPWPEMLFHGRRLTAIRTAQGTVDARTFIVNTSWPGDAYTMIFGIRADVLPVRMENTVICQHDYRNPRVWNALTISPGSPGKPTTSAIQTLTASFCTAGAADIERESLMDKIRSTIPFFSDFIVTADDRPAEKRCFLLPENIPMKKKRGHADMPPLPFPTDVKNLILLPDSSYGLIQAVRAAQAVTANLS